MTQKISNGRLFSDVSAGAPLVRLSNGRYGYQGKDKRLVECSSGYPVDVLVRDGDALCWLSTRFEHNGQDYYLVGCPSLPLAGLIVRERRVQR